MRMPANNLGEFETNYQYLRDYYYFDHIFELIIKAFDIVTRTQSDTTTSQARLIEKLRDIELANGMLYHLALKRYEEAITPKPQSTDDSVEVSSPPSEPVAPHFYLLNLKETDAQRRIIAKQKWEEIKDKEAADISFAIEDLLPEFTEVDNLLSTIANECEIADQKEKSLFGFLSRAQGVPTNNAFGKALNDLYKTDNDRQRLVVTLNRENKKAAKDADKTGSIHSELHAKAREQRRLEREKDSLTTTILGLGTQLKNLQLEVKTLSGDKETGENLIKEHKEELQKQENALKEKLAELQKQQEELTSAKVKLEETQKKAQELDNKVSTQTMQLAHQAKELEAVQQKAQDLDATVMDVQSQLKNERVALESEREALKKEREQNKQLFEEVTMWREQSRMWDSRVNTSGNSAFSLARSQMGTFQNSAQHFKDLEKVIKGPRRICLQHLLTKTDYSSDPVITELLKQLLVPADLLRAYRAEHNLPTEALDSGSDDTIDLFLMNHSKELSTETEEILSQYKTLDPINNSNIDNMKTKNSKNLDAYLLCVAKVFSRGGQWGKHSVSSTSEDLKNHYNGLRPSKQKAGSRRENTLPNNNPTPSLN